MPEREPTALLVETRRSRVPSRGPVYPVVAMDALETMNVSLGRTLLVVAASDGPPWIATI